MSVWRDEQRWTYFLGSYAVSSHEADDLRMFRLTISQLIDTGACRSCEVIKTFGVSKSSVDRAVRLYRGEGAEGFFKKRKVRRSGRVMTAELLVRAQSMLDAHRSRRAVADDLQVPYDTLVKAIADGRLHAPAADAAVVPGSSKSERSIKDAEASDAMGRACTRSGERILAAIGLIDGARIRFESCRDVPCGGILCALPALLANGLLSGISRLGNLEGYYRALHVLLLLGFMALARIKTNESLRGKAPGELGKLMGLDRIPEVRTLRKKMDGLSRDGAAVRWADDLSRAWMQADPEAAGTLYIDGHMRVYHGHQTKVPRKFVSRQRLCLRGVNDYWVNDAIGRPFFVVDKVADPGMLKVLREDIVPRLLADVPGQPTQEQLDADPHLSRLILVFDREGYSPAFFRDMWRDHRIGCITYHKHPAEDWPESCFIEQTVTMARGERATMRLAERGTLVGSGKDAIWMREVRKLTGSGHQTSLIATAYGIEHTVLAAAMFTRWCQENFFAYMMKHFAIDILNEYALEDLADTEEVVNPLWRDHNRQRNGLQGKLKNRQVRFAELTLHPAAKDDAQKIALWEKNKAALLEDIQGLEQQISKLKARIKNTPRHIRWDQLQGKERFRKPAPGRKRLMDAVRMIAYRAETAMCKLIAGPSIDTAQARRFLQDLFTTEADIQPDMQNKRLLVNVHRSSRPAADQALSKLFEQINEAEIIYPGTELTLVYDFVGGKISEPVSSQIPRGKEF